MVWNLMLATCCAALDHLFVTTNEVWLTTTSFLKSILWLSNKRWEVGNKLDCLILVVNINRIASLNCNAYGWVSRMRSILFIISVDAGGHWKVTVLLWSPTERSMEETYGWKKASESFCSLAIRALSEEKLEATAVTVLSVLARCSIYTSRKVTEGWRYWKSKVRARAIYPNRICCCCVVCQVYML